MPDPQVIGLDCNVFCNGVEVLTGSVDHGFEGGDSAYATLGHGDLVAVGHQSTTITIETPETAANPLDAAIALKVTTGVLSTLVIVDKTSGKAATSRVAVSLNAKSRKAKNPSTRSYRCVVAGGELEV